MLIHKLIADEMKVIFNVPELSIVVLNEPMKTRFAPERESSGCYNISEATIYVCGTVDILTFVSTICHEIVHHLQVKMRIFKRFITRRGKTYLFYRGTWYAKCPSYHNQPWEHEAYALESEYARYFYSKASLKLMEGICHHL